MTDIDTLLIKLRQVADAFSGHGSIDTYLVVLYDPQKVVELQQSGIIKSMAELDTLTIKNCNVVIAELKTELGNAADIFNFHTETRIDSVSGNGSQLFIFIDYFA